MKGQVGKNDYSKWPDFSRVSCGFGLCSILFNGINTLTKDYLQSMGSGRVGIIMIDFPGSGLIDAIIYMNPKSLAVADAVYAKQSAGTHDISRLVLTMAVYILRAGTSPCQAGEEV